MDLLKKRIRDEAIMLPGDVLKTDNFMSHQVDVSLMDRIGEEFYSLFRKTYPDKIVTVETSGIPAAIAAARCFNIPCVIAKKASRHRPLEDVYSAHVLSYIHKQDYLITISRFLLERGIRVLIIDEFLSSGNALSGLLDIVQTAGATLCGVGIVVEKAFQHGGDELRSKGVNLKSLCIVESLESGITFREN